MHIEKISKGIFRLKGSIWSGLIVRDHKAILVDAPETIFKDELMMTIKKCGADSIDMVLLTQHRRAYSGGIYNIDADICTSIEEADLLVDIDNIWSEKRYHRYHSIPDKFAPIRSYTIDRIIENGEIINWHGISITAIKFSSISNGDMCYIVDDGKDKIVFCGGLFMSDGKIHDLYSYQKPMGNIQGYHGHLGGIPSLKIGLERLCSYMPFILSPAYGSIDTNASESIDKLKSRIDVYCSEYARYSALKFYFPDEFYKQLESKIGFNDIPEKAMLTELPSYITRLDNTTSFMIITKSKMGILIDAGSDRITDLVSDMLDKSILKSIAACFITHYHDDHVDGIEKLISLCNCKIIAVKSVAEVVSNPSAHFIPCLSPDKADIKIVGDEETWQCDDLKISFLHFPGQTLYHGALLVEKKGVKTLFCGDSFAPSGFDDYCSDNRNLPDENRGFLYCLDVLDKYQPDLIINCHQEKPFIYDSEYINILRRQLYLRYDLLSELLPDDAGLGTDSRWLRSYPFEQKTKSGSSAVIDVHITSHSRHIIKVSPQMPDGWNITPREIKTSIEGLSSGSRFIKTDRTPADSMLSFDIKVPENAEGRYYIPIYCHLDDDFLGSYECAIIDVEK